jgi:hypothetical protein
MRKDGRNEMKRAKTMNSYIILVLLLENASLDDKERNGRIRE